MRNRSMMCLLLTGCLLCACNDTFTVSEGKYRHFHDECHYDYQYDYEAKKDFPTGYYEDSYGTCHSRKCAYGKWVYPKDRPGEDIFADRCGATEYKGNSCAKTALRRGEDGHFRYEGNIVVDENAENLRKGEIAEFAFACGECVNDATKCIGADAAVSTSVAAKVEAPGMVQRCVNGKWQDMGECENGLSCHRGECTGVCLNGDISYAEKYIKGENICVPSRCVDGVWVEDAGGEYDCQSVSCKHVDGKAACGDCTNYARRCTPGKDGAVARVEVCSNGIWVPDDTRTCTRDFCNANNTDCGICKGDETLYDNGEVVNAQGDVKKRVCQMFTCVNGKWSEPVADFNPNGYSCIYNVEKTEYEGICNGTDCEPCNDLQDSEVKCKDFTENVNGEDIRIGKEGSCSFGKMEYKPCMYDADHPVSCKDTTTCGECRNNATRLGNNPENQQCVEWICKDGKWIIWNDGKQYTDVSCKQKEDSLEMVAGDCLDNTIQCQDNDGALGVIRYCTGGQWRQAMNCQGVSCNTTGSDVACGECLNGTTSFANDDVDRCRERQCVGGIWKFISDKDTCSNSCADVGNGLECGQCHNGDHKCLSYHGEDQEEISVRSTCIQGYWSIDEKYQCKQNGQNVSCHGDVCGECQNMSERFVDSNKICKKQICINGVWTDALGENVNPEHYSCKTDSNGVSSIGECKNDSRRCNENFLEICKNGEYSVKRNCSNELNPATGSCVMTGGIPHCDPCNPETDPNECVEDEKGEGTALSCEGTASSGHYTVNLCGSSESRFSCNGTECGNCLNSSACTNDEDGIGSTGSCLNGVLQNGNDSNKCKYNDKDVSCNRDGSGCGVCRNGTEQATKDDAGATIIQKCERGEWVEKEYCGFVSAYSYPFDTDAVEKRFFCGECLNETTKLDNDVNNVCREYECKNGRWKIDSNSQKCDGVSCNAVRNDCGVCLNYTIVPNNTENTDKANGLRTCVNGAFQDRTCYRSAVATDKNYAYCQEYVGAYIGWWGNGSIACYMKPYNEVDNVGYQLLASFGGFNSGRIDDSKMCNKVNETNPSCNVYGNAQTKCGDCHDGDVKCDEDGSHWHFHTCINGMWDDGVKGADGKTGRVCNVGCVDNAPDGRNGCTEDL